jgi:hypothetical protein
LHGSTFKDLTGQRFGRFVVIRVADRGERRDQHTYWLCKCDSEKEKVVQSTNLTGGKSASCGSCVRRMPEGVPARNDLLRSYKYHAQRRGYTWELTKEEFDKLVSADCHYCGLPPSTIHKTGRGRKFPHEFIHNGIDRMDNTLGYIPGNVISCCGTCNLAKGRMPLDEFFTWITRLTAYQSQFQSKKS